MAGHAEGIFIIIIPENILVIRIRRAVVIGVHDDADPCVPGILQNRLPDARRPVNQKHILPRGMKAPDHISHQLFLGV